MLSEFRLEEVLDNRAWCRTSAPFRHITATSVFISDYYDQLDQAFRRILRDGLGEQARGRRISRSMPGYDAYGMTFPYDYNGPFALFMTRHFHDMIAGLFQVPCTGHVNCGIHHHAPGSLDGWVHNDLNPAFFVDYRSDDGINIVRHDQCSYARGVVPNGKPPGRKVVRAVAMIFYLCNDGWEWGDGGCTGLYRYKDSPVGSPDVTIPPLNNSLLLFECTPWSFHSYMSNTRGARNSLIMWLHRSVEDVASRWGEDKIVKWT
ncbi:2-oxoglutarate-Fe(II)-dependent oxygenase superfamily protein [Mesorhizobium loti]|uniref:2-oxoglutarate-Fe(II)-dependent oxygenase superfamily protein n=1 Tax=Rhizobium loti TaxID=381 RepID=A0A8E2W636_RHILI|nr:2OG-Fe(II) oxygenase [Mesorhizobium loti]PWJ86907.1 2-oxoglutarate-Fe(II)-dependent oxygenase superfamily protein [Mesorhizobium loti]